MNWEALGALSEFFGAIAVVGSLVYLARQIQMTRRVDQMAAFQAIVNGFTHHVNEFFSAENELAHRGLTDRDKLTESERLKFDHLLGNMCNHLEMAEGAVHAGLMQEQELAPVDWWFREQIFCHPGARDWLEDFANYYPPAYLKRLRRAAEAALRDGAE